MLWALIEKDVELNHVKTGPKGKPFHNHLSQKLGALWVLGASATCARVCSGLVVVVVTAPSFLAIRDMVEVRGSACRCIRWWSDRLRRDVVVVATARREGDW